MGLTHAIPLSAAPSWPTIAATLAAGGMPVGMRLIDGQPAFPDETPPPQWRELRVASTIAGALRMVTIRRVAAGVELVTWGNADEPSLRLRDAIAAAFTTACGEGTTCKAVLRAHEGGAA